MQDTEMNGGKTISIRNDEVTDEVRGEVHNEIRKNKKRNE